jgi:hypothetical protein
MYTQWACMYNMSSAASDFPVRHLLRYITRPSPLCSCGSETASGPRPLSAATAAAAAAASQDPVRQLLEAAIAISSDGGRRRVVRRRSHAARAAGQSRQVAQAGGHRADPAEEALRHRAGGGPLGRGGPEPGY